MQSCKSTEKEKDGVELAREWIKFLMDDDYDEDIVPERRRLMSMKTQSNNMTYGGYLFYGSVTRELGTAVENALKTWL